MRGSLSAPATRIFDDYETYSRGLGGERTGARRRARSAHHAILLELGAGFAFEGRHVHLEVGGEDLAYRPGKHISNGAAELLLRIEQAFQGGDICQVLRSRRGTLVAQQIEHSNYVTSDA